MAGYGCLCEWDEYGNRVGEHGPLCFKEFVGPEWRQLALHALHDLALLGVDISLISGVTDDVLRQVEDYGREQTSYS